MLQHAVHFSIAVRPSKEIFTFPYLPQCTLSSKMEGLAAYFHQTDPMADAQQESRQM